MQEALKKGERIQGKGVRENMTPPFQRCPSLTKTGNREDVEEECLSFLRDTRKGATGMEEDTPTHPENGKGLIESVCRQDKDSGRAGAGSLECLPENAQNLAEDKQLPERIGKEEQGTWSPPLSCPPSALPQSHKKRVGEVRQEEELVHG